MTNEDTHWHDEAKSLRADGHSIYEIARRLGKSPSGVYRIVKQNKIVRAPWVDEARRLRASGAKIKDIEIAMNRSHASVVDACRGVVPPKSKRSRKQVIPDWWAEAKKMRASGDSIETIVAAIGKSRSQVDMVCRDVVCPVDHLSASRERRLTHQRSTFNAGRRVSSRPRLSDDQIMENRRRERITAMLNRDAARPRPPVTLPRLSFLEKELAL